MSENAALEGLALWRKVAEAQGWRMDWHTDEDNVVGGLYFDQAGWYLCSPDNKYRRVYQDKYYASLDDAWAFAFNSRFFLDIPAFDTDLNTITAADAMLPDDAWVSVTIFPRGADTWARAECVNPEAASGIVHHDEPATAAWNAVLRWLARKQEAGDESVK